MGRKRCTGTAAGRSCSGCCGEDHGGSAALGHTFQGRGPLEKDPRVLIQCAELIRLRIEGGGEVPSEIPTANIHCAFKQASVWKPA